MTLLFWLPGLWYGSLIGGVAAVLTEKGGTKRLQRTDPRIARVSDTS
jgi:hypothetical protein